ncbi:MAG: NAD(P)-dependent oxidoreductase [Luteolibacter sp.]
MKTRRIGIVGLGRMGGNMGRCLKDKGWNISAVLDANPVVADELAAEIGTTSVKTPAEVAAISDVILTVVTNDAAMEEIFFGVDNLLGDASGKVFINCATLSPGIHSRIGEAAKAVGAECLEACMASSIPQAREGTLFLMIGGDEPVFDSQRDLLDDLSAALHFIGPLGKASEVKALVNMVMNINTAALAEGLGIGAALGLDLEMLRNVFRQTGANSRVLETDSDDMIHRDHDCFFSAEHAAKDSGIALELATNAGVNAPLAAATLAQYQRLVAMGLGGLDKSGVAELTFPGRALTPNP